MVLTGPAARLEQGREDVDASPAHFIKAQAEQGLWEELRDHGASLNRALNEALRIHSGPTWCVFQVSWVSWSSAIPSPAFPLFVSFLTPALLALLVGGRSWSAGPGSGTMPSTTLTPTSTGTGGSTRPWTPSSRPSGHLTGGWRTGSRPCWTCPRSKAPRPWEAPPRSRGADDVGGARRRAASGSRGLRGGAFPRVVMGGRSRHLPHSAPIGPRGPRED
jgi:hypothetical protein